MHRRILFLAILLVVGPPILLRADDPSPDNRQVADSDLEAVKAIEAAGGKAVRDPWREEHPVIEVDLSDTKLTVQRYELLGIGRLRTTPVALASLLS